MVAIATAQTILRPGKMTVSQLNEWKLFVVEPYIDGVIGDFVVFELTFYPSLFFPRPDPILCLRAGSAPELGSENALIPVADYSDLASYYGWKSYHHLHIAISDLKTTSTYYLGILNSPSALWNYTLTYTIKQVQSCPRD
jgi:hypothetical protein